MNEAGSTLRLESFEIAHLPAAHELSRAVGWPHRLDDWAFVLALGRGCVALQGDTVVGTALWWPFGEHFARLGMVIVDPARQGGGIGRRLMQRILWEAHPRTVLLNGTEAGLPLYGKLGFRAIGRIFQHQGTPLHTAALPSRFGGELRPAGAADIDAITTLDRAACGMDRGHGLSALLAAGEAAVLERGQGIAGFAFRRRFGRGFLIGPIVASEAADAKALIGHFVRATATDFLRIDVPADSGLSEWLQGLGLAKVDEVVTMVCGDRPEPRGPSRIFALINQALG